MKKVISAIASVCSILSLAFIDGFPNWLKYAIGGIGLVSFLYLMYIDFVNNKSNEIICKNDSEIKNAMKDIIKMNGSVCIMSRDLSWVDFDIEASIKAKTSSMLIFVEKQTELTRSLEKEGVKIKYYGELGFQPRTRFTVIRYNRNNPQVAIANTENSISKRKIKHTIYQTSPKNRNDAWINSLAVDMITLCNAVCKEKEYERKS